MLILMVGFACSCSIKKMAMNQVANALTAPGGSTVFTGDNDPEFVAQALPFAIKMYESLMVSMPWHHGLRLQTGSLYIMYANGFLQTPASMMIEEEYENQETLLRRAKNLYLRGRDMILEALESKYPGFRKNLDSDKFKEAFAKTKKDDIPYLYWSAAGWLGAFAIEPLDMKLGMTVKRAKAMMDRVYQLDPNYDRGAIHDFYVLYYGSMPSNLGGDFAKAREHFKKAIEISGGKNPSPYLSLATSVVVSEQNLDEFNTLLKKVLEINVDDDPNNRLANILNQRKAKWLLAHADNFFLEAPKPGDNGEELQEPAEKKDSLEE